MKKVLVKVQRTTQRQYQPAQVNAPVDATPHASTVAESKPRRTKGNIVEVDKMDAAVDNNTVKLANMYYMQVLKNKVTNETEIHNDLEEIVKFEATGESSKPPLDQLGTASLHRIEKHAHH